MSISHIEGICYSRYEGQCRDIDSGQHLCDREGHGQNEATRMRMAKSKNLYLYEEHAWAAL